MTDEFDPHRPGPPREVHEDAAARERAMMDEERARALIRRLHPDYGGERWRIKVVTTAFREAHAAGKAEGAAEEREACAEIADGYSDTKPVHGKQAPLVATVMNDTAEKIAANIRARNGGEPDA